MHLNVLPHLAALSRARSQEAGVAANLTKRARRRQVVALRQRRTIDADRGDRGLDATDDLQLVPAVAQALGEGDHGFEARLRHGWRAEFVHEAGRHALLDLEAWRQRSFEHLERIGQVPIVRLDHDTT